VSIEWPTIAVLIVTFDRPEEIRVTIRSLQQRLKYSGPLKWYVADDGSPDGYTQAIQKDFPELSIVASMTHRKGWGSNVNVGMRTCAPAEYIYLNEDDYVAATDVDLASGVALMRASDVGLVRYDGIAGHKLNLELREADTQLGRMNYLRISKSSPALNVYSNRPHLRSRKFHKAYGPYAQGKSLGATEDGYAHKVKDLPGPEVACLTTGIPLAFAHIGKTRQGTGEDVHE
jgi:glycosyltransferase involved in cell wall biosynthesis